MEQQTQEENPSKFLCRKVSEALSGIIIHNLDPDFREKSLQQMAAKNGEDANKKLNDLLLKAKEKPKEKVPRARTNPRKTRSQKLQEDNL
jgi:hypothetical protein